MATTPEDEDFVDAQRREVEEAGNRLEHIMKKARRSEGDDVATHDKALQDAKDLLRHARRSAEQLEEAVDEELGRDRLGFQHLIHELARVLEAIEARLDS